MSKIEVNAVEPQCGTTLTLGASGDTVTLASGASQSGFGRTGTVDWNTTKKTADFTATNGAGFFVDSSSSAITVTLPASPSAGNIVSVSDYNGSAVTNKITLARNGSNINGDASNLEISKADSAVTLVYVDATVGWTSVQTSSTSDIQNSFIAATGGTETTSGNFKIHTFTSPGTFTVTNAGTGAGSNTVSYMVIAGGAGGGAGQGSGGGGAGGFRESKASSDCYSASPIAASGGLPVSVQGYPITIGGGGNAGPGGGGNGRGSDGTNSVFSSITSAGGGGGGSGGGGANPAGANGGSGGGGGGRCGGAGGSGNTPPVSPPQGGNGGGSTPSGASPTVDSGGGGGGAAQNGAGGTESAAGGNGGNGATSSINGTPTARAGGGGGGSESGSGGAGGSGGGGAGSGGPSANATNGTTNTGGGGGGKGADSPSSGNGGSGIVVIRYKFQ